MSPLLRSIARLVGLCFGLLASPCLAEAPPRSAPKVLAIDEAHAATARVQVRSYVFETRGDRTMVYILKGARPDPLQDTRQLRGLEGFTFPAGKRPKPDPDAEKDEEGGHGRRYGNASPGSVSGLPGGLGIVAEKAQEYEPVPVDITELRKHQNSKLAEQVRPLRMAIVAGSFPYRKQLDEFRVKLGLDSYAAVLAERSPDRDGRGKGPAFRFLGVEVERQTLSADGKKVLRDWEKADIPETYQVFVFLTGTRFEPEEEKYRPLIVPGLVMPRLLTFKGASEGPPYPDVAGLVGNVVRDLGKARPEHCLVRLIDLTIEPGFAYRYRLRVRMANPNYRRKDVKNPADAREPKLEPGPWFVLKQPVRLSPELHYYAVDQQILDESRGRSPLRNNQTVLQMHCWLDVDRKPGESLPLLVGEWVVAERVPVYRGEYVGHDVPIKFPVWRMTRDSFVIEGEPEKRRGVRTPQGDIKVDFGLRRQDGLEIVLVDFDEGSASTEYGTERVREDHATEVLFLTPEGKLLARSSARDASDPERIRRLKLFRERLALLRRR